MIGALIRGIAYGAGIIAAILLVASLVLAARDQKPCQGTKIERIACAQART